MYQYLLAGLVLSLGLSACLFKTGPDANLQISGTAMTNDSNLIPLEDFFRNPERSQYKLSPNGRYLAYLAPYKDRKNIFVQEVGQTEVKQLTKVTDRDLSDLFWANDDLLLYSRDFGGDENYHIFAVPLDQGGEYDLTPYEGIKAQLIDDLEDDPLYIIVGLNRRNPQFFDPYRLNVRTGELSLLAENPGNITAWLTDHKGKLRAATATDGVNTTLLYRSKDEGPFRSVLTTNFKETVYPLYFDFDNSSKVYALSNRGRDKMAIVKLDLATGQELQLIFEHPKVDVSYMSYSRKHKRLSTVSYVTWKREYHFLDPEVAKLYQRLEQALKGYELVITSTNQAEDRFVVRSYSDRSLGAYYLYDKQSDELSLLAEVSPWLAESKLAEMKPIQYKSRDGLLIQGYLTLPQGREAKNLPVVVNPHGGPWARDAWTFNPEVQFLANRGYAVLQVNFRGSTGYGRRFWEASFKQWGLKMQDDISDGVRYLIDQGIADPERVGIYGGSYGGYATLAGLTFTPELYACGIDYVGVSNLFTFIESIPPYWKPYLEQLHEMVGDPSNPEDSARLRATSPVFHAERIRVPLLIAQGANDPRVKQAESEQMVEALKARGVSVEYILKTDEGHGFRNQENRFEFYARMQAFLAAHLGGSTAK